MQPEMEINSDTLFQVVSTSYPIWVYPILQKQFWPLRPKTKIGYDDMNWNVGKAQFYTYYNNKGEKMYRVALAPEINTVFIAS